MPIEYSETERCVSPSCSLARRRLLSKRPHQADPGNSATENVPRVYFLKRRVCKARFFLYRCVGLREIWGFVWKCFGKFICYALLNVIRIGGCVYSVHCFSILKQMVSSYFHFCDIRAFASGLRTPGTPISTKTTTLRQTRKQHAVSKRSIRIAGRLFLFLIYAGIKRI